MKNIDKDVLGQSLATIINRNISPGYWISIQYPIRDELKNIIPNRINELYDINAVRKNHKHISNLLREAFGQSLGMFFFVEANPDKELEDQTIVPGYYHSHIILDTIQDHIFDEPNRTLKKVYYQSPNPIINRLYYNDQDRYYDLITKVLNNSYWLKEADPDEAICIKPIYNLQSFFIDPKKPNYGYLLKQVDKLGINIVIDKSNSSF
jgi:hypothetical protein